MRENDRVSACWRYVHRTGKYVAVTFEELRRVVDESPLPRWMAWTVFVTASLYATFVVIFGSVRHSAPLFTLPLWLFLGVFCLARIYVFFSSVRAACGCTPSLHWVWLWGALAVFYTAVVACCGTCVSGDPREQWSFVIANKFYDWHPVIHFATMWLVSRVWANMTFVVWVQAMVFAAIVAWLFRELQKNKYPQTAVWGVIAYIVLSPVGLSMVFDLTKDTLFAMACLALLILLLQIWHSDREFVWDWQFCMIFLVAIVYGTFTRHNGILFTAPLLAFFPCMFKRGVIMAIFFALLCVATIGGYVGVRSWSVRHEYVEKSNYQSFPEAVGCPMAIISACYILDPDHTPKETKDLLLKIWPQRTWEKYFVHGNFDAIKFHDLRKAVGENAVGSRSQWEYLKGLQDNITPGAFLKLVWKTCKSCPRRALLAFLDVTNMGWNPFLRQFSYNSQQTPEQLGFLSADKEFVQEVILQSPIGWVFAAPGFMLLVFVVVGGWGFIRYGWSIMPIIAPFICYAIGTTLFLNGWWAQRFFYCSILCVAPFVCLVMIRNESST